MKKSLLALAVLAAASSAQAATVYDKNDTSLVIGGRVQAVVYNGNAKPIATNHDASLVNSARLNIEGETKVNDFLKVFAFSEWNMADGNASNYSTGDHINTREQYVGADFGKYGKLLAGKTYDTVYAVQEVTDVFEDFGVVAQGASDGDRRTGQFRYIYENYGIYAAAGFQTAQDNAVVNGTESSIKSGFSGTLGYTFDDVVFGPLAVKAGYSYILGQNSDEVSNKNFDSFKNLAASISWGSTDEGLYLALLGETSRTKNRGEYSLNKMKGFEFVVGYAFENGLSVLTGYELADVKTKTTDAKSNSYIYRRIPVYANYQLCDSFNVWAEAEFDAGSTDRHSDQKYDEEGNALYETGTKLSLGARYTF